MHNTALGICKFARTWGLSIAGATALYITAAVPASTADENGAAKALSATTPGLTAQELAKLPGVIFARELPDVPGKTLVVVALEFPPRSKQSKLPPNCLGHRHTGSAYVYVTKGTMRMGIANRKSTRLNSSHSQISYAVFCLKKKRLERLSSRPFDSPP